MSFDGLRLQATGPRRAVLLLALLCFVAFFVNNCFLRPDIMETRNLETAREMVEGGNWLVPRMNGEYRLEKPPLQLGLPLQRRLLHQTILKCSAQWAVWQVVCSLCFSICLP